MVDDSSKQPYFYPSLAFSQPVQVMGLDTIHASHDLGAQSELRYHFVDYEYLKSTMGEDEVKKSLVATSYSVLRGTDKSPEERILGMLPSLKVYIHVGKGDDNKWSVHTLSNVLVIDGPPVPLHVSLEILQLYPRNQTGRLLKGPFLPQYHSHPYWRRRV
jgi:hypothetical protein